MLRQYYPWLTLAALALTACGDNPPQTANERLSVVVRITPAAWHFEENRATGIDHDLLAMFAESLGVEPEINYAANTAAALDALCSPETDHSQAHPRTNLPAQLAVGLLTLPTRLHGKFRPGPRYGMSRQQLLHRFDQQRPSNPADLIMKNIEASAEPAHLETLLDIKQRNGDLTNWTLHPNLGSHNLIELIDRGFVDYTIADSHAVMMTKRFYPRVKEAFDLSDELPLYWVFGDCTDARLVSAAETFFAEAAAKRTLEQISDRYYGHLMQLDYPEKLTFIENVDRRLGRYRELFVEAANEAGIDWKLLAAVSYQESHWNPQAHSPSGVKGLMMLTLDTAKQFDVTDRKDPSQSIGAGARFLQELKQRLPSTIKEPDRTWFALAAYNSGPRYVARAMAAARAKELNPALWIDVREFLHRARRTDQATGSAQSLNDPYTYVYNVRAYRDLLAWLEGALRFDVPKATAQEPPLPEGPAPI